MKDSKKSKPRNKKTKDQTNTISTSRLDEMIDEAIIDCYNESEQATGLFTMLEENLSLPFTTTVLGMKVTVVGIECNDADEIVAVCTTGRERQRIPLVDLPLPVPRPGGADWIEAYRRWAKGM